MQHIVLHSNYLLSGTGVRCTALATADFQPMGADVFNPWER